MSQIRKPLETRSRRIEKLARLPVFFALEGKRVALAGGDDAAAWKAELLAATGAKTHVFAREVGEDMRRIVDDFAASGGIILHERGWEPGDLRGAALAVGAIEDDGEAAAFAAAARAAGVPVNVVDKPAFCDFAFGSIVNRSPLVIGISTDGAAPVFGQAIRAKIEAMLPAGIARWAEAAKDWRASVQALALSFQKRRRFWERFTKAAITRPNDAPTEAERDGLLAASASESALPDLGCVTLVGAGPGDAELLTLKAVCALQSADIILYDDLVSRDVLDFARREASTMLVGKKGHGPSCRQDDINQLMVGLARQGKRVVRLKSGDPGIFGRAGEEIEACRAAGIAVEMVPGISAGQGAAASLSISLTHRDHARRLQFVTGHARDGELPDDLSWRDLSDPGATTVLYMPRRTLAEYAARAIAAGLDPQTPAIALINATWADESRVFGTIASLPEKLSRKAGGGPAIVLVGKVLEQIQQSIGEVRMLPIEVAGTGPAMTAELNPLRK